MGHQGPLAWVLSVHTVQQLMLEELHEYKLRLLGICKGGHNHQVVVYLACRKARFCKLVVAHGFDDPKAGKEKGKP